MRLRLLSLVFVAAACGGKSKPTTPPPTLPDDKPAEVATKPAEPEKPAEPAEPPPPQGPVDVTLSAPKVEVKLVSAGKGKKSKLALSPKAGAKQTIQWTLDLTVGQDGPPQVGGKQEQIAPTATFTAEAETKEVDAKTGQAKYVLTVSGVDATDKPDSKVKAAEFKGELASLVGATFAGSVDANGIASDVVLHIEKPDQKAVGTVQFLQLAALPMWPALPTEAVGTGAKWTVTSTQKLAGQVDITKTVTYELVGKKGTVWTIKGSTKVEGQAQEIQPGAKLDSIAGEGAHEVALTDGALLPLFKQAMSTGFTVNLTPPAGADGKQPDPVAVKFFFNFGNVVAPKS